MIRRRSCLVLSVVFIACAPASKPREPSAPHAAPIAERSVAAPPAPPDRAFATKVDAIFADYTKPGSPGCAVGVYRAGEILFARGYGLASIEHDLHIAHDTVFDIGSVSKQFTAAAILLLVQDGKLSLDDDVRKYVPELPDYGRAIRLRHLLHHTSGLRDYAGLLGIAGFDDADVTNDDDALFAIAHQKALNFTTGTQWSYSNSGYFLLSVVVKRVTGKKLSLFAKERIFDPLAMKSTRVLDDHTLVVPRRATGYAPRDGGGFGVAMSDFEQAGDGAVQTTIDDLARWDANFYEPTVGGRAMIDALRTPGRLDDGTTLRYAMGLFATTANGIALEEHAGAWAGYRADMLRFPTERLTVACLCNVASADPSALADAVATVVLPKLAEAPAPESREAPASKNDAASSADLAPLVGAYYDAATFHVLTMSVEDRTLVVGFGLGPGAPHRRLERVDARTFVEKVWATRFVFEPASGAVPAHLDVTRAYAKPMTLQRIEPVAVGASALAEYVGRYSSEEMVHDMQIALVDGKLRAGAWGRTPGSPPFEPVLRDVFNAEGVAFRFERDARGHVRGLVLGADRLQGIRWARK